ncbi:MAG: dienelactone hydrolase family protein [Armatimonadota bacterium]
MITAIASILLSAPLGKNIEYTVGGDHFVGYGAKASNSKANAPVVYVIQDWNGVDAHEQEVVEKLAAAGYNAFAIDIYCKGVRPHDVKGCSGESGKYYADPALYMKRIGDGVNAFPTKGKKFYIGYCFGGTGVLEVARRNMGAAGVVSFHGGLKSLSTESPKDINTNVLVLHGKVDPFVPAADVEACKKEMLGTAKTFRFVSYGGAVHAFTVKDMGFKVDGAKYDANADTKSWAELMKFLKANR